jgi:hypothetical protein
MSVQNSLPLPFIICGCVARRYRAAQMAWRIRHFGLFAHAIDDQGLIGSCVCKAGDRPLFDRSGDLFSDCISRLASARSNDLRDNVRALAVHFGGFAYHDPCSPPELRAIALMISPVPELKYGPSSGIRSGLNQLDAWQAFSS